MLAVLQRVSEARVLVDGETIGEIGRSPARAALRRARRHACGGRQAARQDIQTKYFFGRGRQNEALCPGRL